MLMFGVLRLTAHYCTSLVLKCIEKHKLIINIKVKWITLFKTITEEKKKLLTHSSSPDSVDFPSGCCRLKLWPSGRCLSELLARNKAGQGCC